MLFGELLFSFISLKKRLTNVLEWTAGNAWHGSILTVLWLSCFNNERRLIRRRGWTSSPFPLERFSPITDKKLLRPGRQRLRPGTVNNSSSLRLPQRSPLHRVIQVSQPSHYVGRRAAAGKGLSTGLPTPYYNAMVRSNFPNSKLLMPLGSLSSRNYQMTMDNQQYDGVSKALQYQSSSGGINFWIPHIMISDPLCSATLHHATPAMTSTMPVLAYPGPQVGATYTPFASPPSSRPHVCTGCYYTTLDRTPTSRDRENPSNTEHCVVTAGNLSHKMIQEAIKDGNSSKASITSSAKGGPVIANGAIDSLDFDLEAPILYDEKTVEGIADDGV